MSKSTGNQDTLFKRRVLRAITPAGLLLGAKCHCGETAIWASPAILCEKHGEEYLEREDGDS